MPKFRINCSATVAYTVLVDAPTEAAAQMFYDLSDGWEYARASVHADWNLTSLHVEHGEQPPDFTINAEGEIVSRHSDTPVEGQ